MNTIIVATDKNGGIGLDNKIPWKHYEDLKWFKEYTTGKRCIVGRKTYDSIGKLLKNRNVIVWTNQILGKYNYPEFSFSLDVFGTDTIIYTKYIDALLQPNPEVAKILAEHQLPTETCIIGGAKLYFHCFNNDYVDKVILTKFDFEAQCDTYFPVKFLDNFELKSEDKIYNGVRQYWIKRNPHEKTDNMGTLHV